MLIPFDYLFSRYQIKCNGVLHLGANTGQEAAAYEQAGIKNVVWVEALPNLMPALRKHVEPYGHQCICACVSDVDGKEVTFNVANNGGQSSSFLEFGTHSTAHPTVRFATKQTMCTTRVDTLLRSNRVVVEGTWFLNADLQGAELLALKGMGDLLWKFGWAYIEVNDKELYKGCPRTHEIDAYLAQYGFVGMETRMTGWGWGDKLFQRFAKC